MSAELEHLLHAYMDGAITAEAMSQLNARLLEDADARREFAELLNMDSALAALAAGYEAQTPQQAATAPHKALPKMQPLSLRVRWLAAAACVIALLVGGWWWQVAHQPFATV
ncbi:MAG TPA: hypothetical protein VLE43_10730, partial [Candidatus Saccharimonadia bacterium]|nr:hypothetical protein [Candidatus Saccharimonadia bacterium]